MTGVDFLNLAGGALILFGVLLVLWLKREGAALDRKFGTGPE